MKVQHEKRPINIDKELSRLDRKDKRRKRSRSRSEDFGSPTTKAIKRAEEKTKKNRYGKRLVSKTNYKSSEDESDNSSGSESDES